MASLLLPRELLTVSLRLLTRRCYTTGSNAAPPPATPPRYSFTTSYAFLGKPSEPKSQLKTRLGSAPPVTQALSDDSPIKRWRDETLKKSPQGAGHDWFFVRQEPDATVVGVADGVGGWEESGVDPSLFSQVLMYYADRAVADEGVRDPREIMWAAVNGVAQEEDVIAGGSTGLIATLEAGGRLRVANLGDSTFYLIRDDRVVYAQPAQTFFFNAPYQFSKEPNTERDRKDRSSKRAARPDTPDHADLIEAQLQDGDMVLAVTDGYSDNVFPQETEALVALVKEVQKEQSLTDQAFVERMCYATLNFARMCSAKQLKENKESPFELEAQKHNLAWRGGKTDDITVVAVLVKAIP